MSQHPNQSETPPPKGKDSVIFLILLGFMALIFIIVRLGDSPGPEPSIDHSAQNGAAKGEANTAAPQAISVSSSAQNEPQVAKGELAGHDPRNSSSPKAEESAPAAASSATEQAAPVTEQPDSAPQPAAVAPPQAPPVSQPQPAMPAGDAPIPAGYQTFESFTPPPGWGMQRAPDGSIYLTPPVNR
jgi:hypothetical protein